MTVLPIVPPVAAVPVARPRRARRRARRRCRPPRAPRARRPASASRRGRRGPSAAPARASRRRARRVGTITTHLARRARRRRRPRTPCDPGGLPRRAPARACERSRRHRPQRVGGRVRSGLPAALGDHAGALEHGEEAARGLARGAGELREVGLGGGDEDVGRRARPAATSCSTSSPSTTATRLWTVWKDWRERRSLISRRRRPSAITRRMAICGCSPISRRMSGPSTPTTLGRLERLDGGRAQLVLEHRELAEDIAGAERRERDRAPVAVLAHGAGCPVRTT